MNRIRRGRGSSAGWIVCALALAGSILCAARASAQPSLQKPAQPTVVEIAPGQTLTIELSDDAARLLSNVAVTKDGKPVKSVTAELGSAKERPRKLTLKATDDAPPGEQFDLMAELNRRSVQLIYVIKVKGRDRVRKPIGTPDKVVNPDKVVTPDKPGNLEINKGGPKAKFVPPAQRTKLRLAKFPPTLVNVHDLKIGNLQPAKPKRVYSPQDWAAYGDVVAILMEPAGVDADLVQVHIGEVEMAIVDATSNADGSHGMVRVLAPNQTVTGPVTMTFFRNSADATGRTETAEQSYRVLDPWTDFQPTATVHSLHPGGSYSSNMTVFEGVHTDIWIDFQEVPGDRVVKYQVVGSGGAGFDLFSYYEERHENPPTAGISRGELSDISSGLGIVGGVFTGSGSFELKLKLTVKNDVTGDERTVTVPVGNFNVAARTKYTISNTKDLKDILNFQLRACHGTCEGTSAGCPFVTPDVSVGQLIKGNDLTFSIRSGPLGTSAMWEMPEIVSLHGQWTISKMNWSEHRVNDVDVAIVSQDGTNKCGPKVVFNPGIDRHPFQFVGWRSETEDNIMGDAEYRYAPGSPYMRTLTVFITSGVTVCNDQGVEARLDSVEVLGPPGKSAMDAFK